MAPLDLSHYPESAAVERWGDGESYGCAIVLLDHLLPAFAPYYCGYVRFKHPPTIRSTDNLGSLDYAPVHGGITYAALDPDDGSMVYGFDCNHAWDQDDPKDLAYVKAECETLRQCVEIAGALEQAVSAGAVSAEDAARIDWNLTFGLQTG